MFDMNFKNSDRIVMIDDFGDIKKGAVGVIVDANPSIPRGAASLAVLLGMVSEKFNPMLVDFGGVGKVELVPKGLCEIEGEARRENWKIEIAQSGDETVAKLFSGERVVKTATVKRYYKDKNSTKAAASAVIEKLFSKEKKPVSVVGSRVKVNEGVGQRGACGKTGRIINEDETAWLVEFDENIGGHSGAAFGEKRGKNGHCWWCRKEICEVI